MKDKYIAITLGVIVVIILNILVFFAMKHTNKEDADRYSSYAQESKPKPKPYTPRVIKFIKPEFRIKESFSYQGVVTRHHPMGFSS